MSSELFKGIHYYVVDEKVKDPVAVSGLVLLFLWY